MEEFLRSGARLALVHGGVGTGKTTFVNHLLASRLYEKAFISIDGRTSRNVWSLIEQLFSQTGLRLNADVLSALPDLRYAHTEAPLGQFLNRFADQIVIVLEHFDELLDSNGRFVSADVERFIHLIASKSKIKLVLTSRNDFIPPDLAKNSGSAPPQIVRVGRFGTDLTIANILDDHFDRGKFGLSEYPAKLLGAIDRHPLIATLVGQILKQQGPKLISDDTFLRQVKNKLRIELFARLLDDRVLPAVEAASKLRIATPRILLEALASQDAIFYAKSAELLYAVPDYRWGELLSTLGLFRKRTIEDLAPEELIEQNAEEENFHQLAADCYLQIYRRQDDDPKWIRESHFHRMLSGGLSAGQLAEYSGQYYVPELISSAHYCFRTRRDYKL
ncbi:MAG: AAA family ATPase, partial [Fimbriimonadaceae bacterium]